MANFERKNVKFTGAKHRHLCLSLSSYYPLIKNCLFNSLLKPVEKTQEIVPQVLETGCKPVLLHFRGRNFPGLTREIFQSQDA